MCRLTKNNVLTVYSIVATCIHLSRFSAVCLIKIYLQTTPYCISLHEHLTPIHFNMLSLYIFIFFLADYNIYIMCKHHLAALAPNMLCMLLVFEANYLSNGIVGNVPFLPVFTLCVEMHTRRNILVTRN